LEPGLLWIDGLPVDDPLGQLSLGPGLHYVQLGGPTWTTFVVDLPPAGASVLWLPDAVSDQAVEWIGDPSRQSDLDGLLGLVLPAGAQVELTTDTARWAGHVGAGDYVPVEKTRHTWRWVGLGGLAIAGGSLVATGSGYLGGWRARSASFDAVENDSWADYQLAVLQHELARRVYRAGFLGLAGGVAIAGAGFALDRWALGVNTAQGGLGLSLGVAW
jgi:hypothetical protein